METDRWRKKHETFCERRWLRSPPRPKTWPTPFVNSLSPSEALNWNCRRAGRCRSRRISNDRLGHECAVGAVAADTIGQGVGLDAITALDRAFHDNDYGGGASMRRCLVAARKTTRFVGVHHGADIGGAFGRKNIAVRQCRRAGLRGHCSYTTPLRAPDVRPRCSDCRHCEVARRGTGGAQRG